MESQVNVTALQEELDEAKKTGSMDEVFREYCKKIPNVMSCVKNVTDAIKPCLEDKEKDSLKTLSNITESLLDFACLKDGDKIASKCFFNSEKYKNTFEKIVFSVYC